MSLKSDTKTFKYKLTHTPIMAKTSNKTTNGTHFLENLTLLFIGLKLTNFIDWAWWEVLSPIWIPLALAVIVIIVYGIGYLFK